MLGSWSHTMGSLDYFTVRREIRASLATAEGRREKKERKPWNRKVLLLWGTLGIHSIL